MARIPFVPKIHRCARCERSMNKYVSADTAYEIHGWRWGKYVRHAKEELCPDCALNEGIIDQETRDAIGIVEDDPNE